MGKKTILVTGGLGYIGSHTTVELISEGFDVIIVDNLSNAEKFMLDRIETITTVRPVFYEKDICDQKAVHINRWKNSSGYLGFRCPKFFR